MRKVLTTSATLLALVSAYLLLWPVPVDPVSWQAPVDRGYVDPFAPNKLLKATTGIALGGFQGPEDAALGLDGRIYVTTDGGAIIRIQNRGISEFVNVGGGLTYANECCEIDFFVKRDFAESKDAPASTSFGVQVKLFTLGNQDDSAR